MLLEYSNKVEAGQHVLIKGNYSAKPLIKELIKHTYRIGAYPHIEILDDEIGRELSLGNTEERMFSLTFLIIYFYRHSTNVLQNQEQKALVLF